MTAGTIAISQRIPSWAIEALVGSGFEIKHRDEDSPASSAELRALVEGAHGLLCFLTDPVDRSVLDAATNLEVVSTVAAGYDNIDVRAASELDILVCHTPDVLTAATADLTMALLLAAARRIPENDDFLRGGGSIDWRLDQPLMGVDVTGATIGIVGAGKIGQAVARRARAFDMRVVYTGRSRLPLQMENDLAAEWLPFDDVLMHADFISLHLPLTPETRLMIDALALERMRRTAILINTARGALVDEEALADALDAGSIAGAALDVFTDEPAVNPRLLRQRKSVVLSPHIGSATIQTRHRMLQTAVQNVIAALSNVPRNIVRG